MRERDTNNTLEKLAEIEMTRFNGNLIRRTSKNNRFLIHVGKDSIFNHSLVEPYFALNNASHLTVVSNSEKRLKEFLKSSRYKDGSISLVQLPEETDKKYFCKKKKVIEFDFRDSNIRKKQKEIVSAFETQRNSFKNNVKKIFSFTICIRGNGYTEVLSFLNSSILSFLGKVIDIPKTLENPSIHTTTGKYSVYKEFEPVLKNVCYKTENKLIDLKLISYKNKNEAQMLKVGIGYM